MAKPPHRYWQDLTTADFDGLDREGLIAVLPVAAIEQHGPHLPLDVDARINEGLIAGMVARVPDDLPVLVLPMQAVGWSDEHGGFPGTLSVSPETLTKSWYEICASVTRSGVRKLVLFNSHGGQTEILKIVTRKLRIDHGMLAVGLNWFALAETGSMFDAEECAHGIHAGAIETSMMLHLYPGSVREQAIDNFPSAALDMKREFKRLGPTGKVPFGWETQDLHPSGAVGDPRAASAEKGAAIVDQVVERFLEVLDDVNRFDLTRLKSRAP
jgi:creatinine amidohydrolase